MSRILSPAVLLSFALLAGCEEHAEQPLASENWQRLDASGHIMRSGNTSSHRCVLDPAGGLMWQVHDDAGGVHDRDNRFSWYSSDKRLHMSEPGLADGGDCRGTECDTQSLVATVNEHGLCGFSDWRLPNREELMSLGEAERRESGLIVDRAFFPEAIAGEYWTVETFRLYPQSAWAVNFANGLDRADRKSSAKAVRLVRTHTPATETN